METIYNHIEEALKRANIKGIVYKKSYPRDLVELVGDPTEDEEMDTLTPLLEALAVIQCTIENFGSVDDDIEVVFFHLPGEEEWGISIGDGR